MTARREDDPAGAASLAPRPPLAERRPVRRTVHGVTLTDDYAWLRAENWQAVMRDPSVLAADIRAYLEAENAYADAVMADTDALRRTLVAEMRGRIKEDDSSVPQPDGPYAYGMRYREGGEHPLVYRTARDGSGEMILLDGDALAQDKAFFRLGGVAHSTDHRVIAWAADETGSEFYTVRFREADTGRDLDDVLPETTGGVVWANDGKTVFYVLLDANHRPCRVLRHVLGTPREDDVLVYEEPDHGFFVGIGKTQSRRFIVIDCHDHATSEIRLIDADDPSAEPVLVAPRKAEEQYAVEDDGEGTLFVLTNADDAEDFRIATAPVAAPGRENWRDLVPHRRGRLILSMTAYKGRLVRLEREDGLPRIVIRSLADGEEHAISFEEEAYSLGLVDGYEFATDLLRFTYSSMTTPGRVYDYDMATRSRVLRKQDEVPSGHDPATYVTRRLHARAPDGESIPLSLLYRRGTPLDGSAPCLLYGYGAYGITIPAAFSTNRLSLVDRGFIFAIAHVRGGKDKGFRWYRLGRRQHKVNTFTDFIAAAEHLIEAGYTARGRIVAQGGSAGGMLMGVVANRAPELFAAILAEVPFVDVLNTMLDESLPLTPPEWPEWGNPIADREAFETIRSYSPYDNVSAHPYPAILALAGLADPRVTYWEPAKWVAKLRAMKTDASLLLLKTNMQAGHAGAAGRFARLEEVALSYAFALKAVGLDR